jgi:hypothetical protein
MGKLARTPIVYVVIEWDVGGLLGELLGELGSCR